jgi:hypothetical protein
MANPCVRQIGAVEDLDGRKLAVGVDHDVITLGGFRFGRKEWAVLTSLSAEAIDAACEYERPYIEAPEAALIAAGFPVVPAGQIEAEVAADVRRLAHPHIAPVETGEPWRGPAQADWDGSRDG